MKEDANQLVDKTYVEYSIAQKVIEKERHEQLENCVRESTDWYAINRSL